MPAGAGDLKTHEGDRDDCAADTDEGERPWRVVKYKPDAQRHDGRSHCEEEFTRIDDIEYGARTLLLAALDLAGRD